jgi:carbon starvation protein
VGSLALLVISVWLLQQNRNFWYTLVPMIFITLVTFVGTVYNFKNYLSEQNWLLVSIAFVIGACQIWIIVEAASVFLKMKDKMK